MTIVVRPLRPADADACDAIILGHPDFFGHEGGRQECACAVRSQDGWVADSGGCVLGFATWEARTAETAELTWAAIARERRHEGIGTGIVEALVADVRARGFSLCLVMTSAGQNPPQPGADTYEPSRRFWRARGFLPLIEMDIWDTNTALLLVRPLVR